MFEIICDILEGKKSVLIGASLLVLYLSYYFIEVAKRPRLICGDDEFRAFLESGVPVLRDRVWSTPWCFEARMQTVLAGLLRSHILPQPTWCRELLTLSDGGTVALEWAPTSSAQRGVLVVLPGLTGAADADYVRLLRAAADCAGLRAAVLLPRGRHAPLTSARLYSAVSHADVGEVLHLLHERGHTPLLAAGVSLGAILLANHMAQIGDRCVLSGALLLSAPLDVPACAKQLQLGAAERAMSRVLAASLKRTLEHLPSLHEAAGDAWRGARSLREFDASFTAPHCGFSHVDEYYSAASAANSLAAVRVPLLALAAADDPLQPEHVLPVEQFSRSQWSALALTERGGHIGFMTGWWPSSDPSRHFVSQLAQQYFVAILQRRPFNVT